MIEPLITLGLLQVLQGFGVNIAAAAAFEWIAAKWKTAGVTNHDLQKALRESYCDALSSIEFGFRRREGLLDSLGKRRLYREITASFDKEFLTPFISETSLSQDELESLAREGAKYCRILREAVDLLLPKEDVPNITIENLLLTGRKLEGADDLRKLNDKAKADLMTKVRSVEGVPKFFFDFLDYKDLLMGSMVFFYGERIKADERVRSILTHAELQRIREEQSKQYQKQAAKLETALQSQMSAFQQFLSPIKDNFAEVLTCLERLEAEWAETTRYLQRILDLISLDKGLSDKDKRQLEAGLSPSFDLHAKYEFDERKPIGYGAVATVYRALHRGLRQVRAIKVLKPEHRENQEVVERFLREAVVLGSLKHANIVQIYDAGGGGPNLDFYLEMEYVEGVTLRNFIKTHEFDWQRILKFIKQLGSAVQKVHESGIIHRDLNPRNIMVDKNGDLKVMDFGVAKIIGVEGLTKDGQVVGTTNYIAPEQARGERVDERADIYSFGVILYELCTRRLPSTPALPLRQYEPGVPEWLEDIIVKCLKPERELRYTSIKELTAVIEAKESPATAPVSCALHPNKDAIAVCVTCGKKICDDCRDTLKGKHYCHECAEKVLQIPPPAPRKAIVEPVKPMPAPALSVDTERINFVDVRVGSHATKSFTVSNTGTGRLTGGITTSHPWLKVSPDSIDLEKGRRSKVSVTVDATRLNEGVSIDGLININSNGGESNLDVSLSTVILTRPTPAPVPKRAGRRKLFLFAIIGVVALAILVPAVMTVSKNMLSKSPGSDKVPVVAPGSIDTSKIALQSDRDGNYEIYVMGPDGSNQIRLTYNDLDDISPSWSPDGGKIVFASKRDQSHDRYGRKIFIHNADDYEIYTMNADGSNQSRLTNNRVYGCFPVWSPDGSKIAFVSNRDGNWEIYTMSVDGSNQTRLTSNDSLDFEPAWSPDGKNIAFVSDRDGNLAIYIMNTDGSNQKRLTFNDYADFSPAWSPDGQKIAFIASRDVNGEIYLMNADGSNQTRITNNNADDEGPVWSPDGKKIAFTSYRDGNYEIYLMNADGSNQIRLTNNQGENGCSSWSPMAASKTYTLSTNVVPETGGEIRIVSPSSGNGTFEPGSQVTLTAIPADCYTFSYWDGIASSSKTVTITMDSNKSVTANFRLKETTPPVISEIKADSSSDISATITWLTDKPATGQVDYGKTKEYGLTTISNDELATNHRVRMTGLEPNTTYYFTVKSADKCGSEASATKMLTTLREISFGERVGERALDFTLPYYNDDNPESPNKAGKTETLSTYIGKKKILLNFWSTFCEDCISEFPCIRGIYEDEELADRNSENADFVVFTVCIDSKIDEAPGRIKTLEGKFSDEVGPFTFPILVDINGQTKKDYHVGTIPETVFIDTDGIIREIKYGPFSNQAEIESILHALY